jgi:uncharacterized membrane protein
MPIKPFPLLIALLPLATYLLVLGLMRAQRKPLVTTNIRDAAALAIAVSGLVMIGPIHLFFPSAAAAELGWVVWVVLAVFYGLCVTLLLLSLRPKIVVYGIKESELMQNLQQVAAALGTECELDHEHHCVRFSQPNVLLRLEHQGVAGVVGIELLQRSVHPIFWSQLLFHLRRQLKTQASPITGGTVLMLLSGVMMVSYAAYLFLFANEELLAGFRTWLQL